MSDVLSKIYIDKQHNQQKKIEQNDATRHTKTILNIVLYRKKIKKQYKKQNLTYTDSTKLEKEQIKKKKNLIMS